MKAISKLKDFNTLTQEEKINIIKCIKIECENEIDKSVNEAWDKTLLSIVQSHGITYKSLWDGFSAVCGDYIDECNFCGVDFPLAQYKQEYVEFCRGQLSGRMDFLEFEIREEYDLDELEIELEA